MFYIAKIFKCPYSYHSHINIRIFIVYQISSEQWIFVNIISLLGIFPSLFFRKRFMQQIFNKSVPTVFSFYWYKLNHKINTYKVNNYFI